MQVVLPYYTSLPQNELKGLQHVLDFDCPKGKVWDGKMQPGSLRTSLFRCTIDGIPMLLICPADRHECNLFVGDRIYGGSYNELEAYLYLSRCCTASDHLLSASGKCWLSSRQSLLCRCMY